MLVEDLAILIAKEAVVDEVVEVEAGNGLQVGAHGDVDLAATFPVLDLSVDALSPKVALVTQHYQVKGKAEGGQSSKGELGVLPQADLQGYCEEEQSGTNEEQRIVYDLDDSHHVEDAHLKLASVEEHNVLGQPDCSQYPVCFFQEEGVGVEDEGEAVSQQKRGICLDLFGLRVEPILQAVLLSLVLADKCIPIVAVGQETVDDTEDGRG